MRVATKVESFALLSPLIGHRIRHNRGLGFVHHFVFELIVVLNRKTSADNARLSFSGFTRMKTSSACRECRAMRGDSRGVSS